MTGCVISSIALRSIDGERTLLLGNARVHAFRVSCVGGAIVRDKEEEFDTRKKFRERELQVGKCSLGLSNGHLPVGIPKIFSIQYASEEGFFFLANQCIRGVFRLKEGFQASTSWVTSP